MDLLSSGDVAVRHIVAFNTFNIKHTIEVSDSVISLTKVVGKYLAIIVGVWAGVSVSRSFLEFHRRSRQ